MDRETRLMSILTFSAMGALVGVLAGAVAGVAAWATGGDAASTAAMVIGPCLATGAAFGVVIE